MRVRIDDDHMLNSISSMTLATYLKGHRWRLAGTMGDEIEVYQIQAGGRTSTVHVPVRDTFADHADSIARALRTLSVTEERSELDVYGDVRATSADRIRVSPRNASNPVHLSLHDAGHLMTDAYNLLSSAARATEKPRAAYRGSISNRVASFLGDISAAPLGFDAYELTLYSPLRAAVGQASLSGDFADTPFARRAIVELAGGLTAVEAAIVESKQADELSPFERAVPAGVSANLCGAIAALVEHADQFGDGISVDVGWAAVRPRDDSRDRAVPFSTHDVEVLTAAGDHLRHRASYPDEHLVADVFRLERDPREFDGRATLLADLDDRTQRVEVEFAEGDYQTAIEAHDQKLPIELDGDLHPVGRGYELRNPSNVRRLGEPSA